MSVARDFGIYTYTADNAVAYNVRIDKTFGTNADAGFSAGVQGQPYLPARYMRYALGLHDASGRRAKHPCGTKDCDLFTGEATTFTRPVIGDDALVTFEVTDTRGETVKRRATVHNI